MFSHYICVYVISTRLSKQPLRCTARMGYYYIKYFKYLHKCSTEIYLCVFPGKDYKKLWSDIKEAILTVYLDKETSLIEAAWKYKTTRLLFVHF